MKITIVTAVYNREATVERAIRSVQAQTYADIEHVVIDGASRDRTCEVVEACNSPLVKLLSEPDHGIYDAINKGIRASSGEIIGLLHSDDLFADNGVISRVAACFQDSGLDAVYADVAFFNEASPGRPTRRYDSGRFRADRLRFGWMPAHTSLFLRRRVFDRFGLYRTDYRSAADFEFIARIFKGGGLNTRYLNEVFVHMQLGGMSTSGFASYIRTNREVLRACRENGIKTDYLKLFSKYPFKLLELIRR